MRNPEFGKSELFSLNLIPYPFPCILHDEKNRRVYILNHLEYDAETLKGEYERDDPMAKHTGRPSHVNEAHIVTEAAAGLSNARA